MLGEFYGMSAVSSLMLELNSHTILKLSALKNSKMDVSGLSKFITELDGLEKFLEERVRLRYTSPEIKEGLRKAELIRSNAAPQLMRIFSFDVSEFSEEDRIKMAEELENNTIKMATDMGIEKDIVNSFTPYNSVDRISLGDRELAVIRKFLKEYRDSISMYRRRCSLSSFEEVSVFNMKLHEVALKDPRALLSSVIGMFTMPVVNTDELVRKCLEWVSVVRAHFKDELVADEVIDNSDFVVSGDFTGYIALELGINREDLFGESKYSDYAELCNRFESQRDSYRKVMTQISESNLVNSSTLLTLEDLYFKLYRLDYDRQFICERLFDSSSFELLSFDEIDRVHSNLNRIGMYYFNRCNSKLFLENVKKCSFSKNTKTIIDPNGGPAGYTFRRVLEDIEYFCYSVYPAGTVVREGGV